MHKIRLINRNTKPSSEVSSLCLRNIQQFHFHRSTDNVVSGLQRNLFAKRLELDNERDHMFEAVHSEMESFFSLCAVFAFSDGINFMLCVRNVTHNFSRFIHWFSRTVAKSLAVACTTTA